MKVAKGLLGGLLVLGACSTEGGGIAPEPRGTAGARNNSGGAQNAGGSDQTPTGGGNGANGGATPIGAGGTNTTPGNASGSRIKLRWYVGDDGSRQLAGAYDSERKEACTWQRASDGQLRCMPAVDAWPSVWADTDCSVPLFVTECQTAKYGGKFASACSAPTLTLTLYALTKGPLPTEIWSGSPGNCIKGVPNPIFTYYTGTLIDPAAFQKGAERID